MDDAIQSDVGVSMFLVTKWMLLVRYCTVRLLKHKRTIWQKENESFWKLFHLYNIWHGVKVLKIEHCFSQSA